MLLRASRPLRSLGVHHLDDRKARPLREVLEDLGRYHRATVTVTAPAVLDTKVSGIFPTDNLPQAMQTIAATLPISLTRRGEQNWQIVRR